MLCIYVWVLLTVIYIHTVYDLETYSENENVIAYCACVLYKNKTHFIYKNEKNNVILESLTLLWELSENVKIEVYVHNLNYDGMLIINEVSKHKINYEIRSNKTNIYFIKIFYLNKIIKFRCSYKLLPLSLELIGKIENHPKLEFPHKFVNKENLNYVGPVPAKDFWENEKFYYFFKSTNKIFDLKKEILFYCENDVKLVHKFLHRFLNYFSEEEKKNIKKCYSIASIAHKLFFLKYNNCFIDKNLPKTHEEFIRDSYFGGRCEVFGNLKKNEHVKYFDFSGMYAQCMQENFHNGEGDYFFEGDWNLPGFHAIEYESNFNYLPILPSHSASGKLLFANGRGVGTFWFEEIQTFVKYGGTVIKVKYSIVYSKFEKVFKNFVEYFDEIKKKDEFGKFFGKLMINSLYGGMALNSDTPHLYITFSEVEFYELLNKVNVENFYKVNESFIILIKVDYKSVKFFKNKKKNSFSERNVSYSAAIAAKARVKLYKCMLDVMNDGGRLLYCDTDSIFAAYSKNDKRTDFKTTKWLAFYDDAVFMAPKTYALRSEKEEIKIKGVIAKNVNFYDLKKKFYDNETISFKNQLNFKRANFVMNQQYLTKTIFLSTYDKRLFNEDKTETSPLYK